VWRCRGGGEGVRRDDSETRGPFACAEFSDVSISALRGLAVQASSRGLNVCLHMPLQLRSSLL
jgi:hypothetical protein